MAAYYNEIDPKAAAMLRQLIIDGIIAPGVVDERSIEDVRPDELSGYTQCHFFAGIGGWSVALRLAGWDDNRPVWTGSCPCQPFSAAGKGDGFTDERHLWPAFEWLISQCLPATVFGEQVERAITYGWWDDVATDLEGSSYACAAEVLPACSVGFPHRRDRLWFMADTNGGRRRSNITRRNDIHRYHAGRQEADGMSGTTNKIHVENAEGIGRGAWRPESEGEQGRFSTASAGSSCGTMAYSTINDDCGITGEFSESHEQQEAQRPQGGATQSGGTSALGDTDQQRSQGYGRWQRCIQVQEERENEIRPAGYADGISWIECPDGKARPVKRGIRLLAHGVQHRASILHAFGNAIVPQVAAEFIKGCEALI